MLIPDYLVAHIISHKFSLDREFNLGNNISLLQEVFNMADCKLSNPPREFCFKNPPFHFMCTVKSSLKAHVKLSYRGFWRNSDLMEHVIFSLDCLCL